MAKNTDPCGRYLSDPWKTGQRVPATGKWVDQHGSMTVLKAHTTFPPCLDRNGECAIRVYVGK